jgi:hypothetical protein
VERRLRASTSRLKLRSTKDYGVKVLSSTGSAAFDLEDHQTRTSSATSCSPRPRYGQAWWSWRRIWQALSDIDQRIEIIDSPKKQQWATENIPMLGADALGRSAGGVRKKHWRPKRPTAARTFLPTSISSTELQVSAAHVFRIFGSCRVLRHDICSMVVNYIDGFCLVVIWVQN